MVDLVATPHGEARMAQRALREADLDILLAHGTEIGGGRIMMLARDAAKAIQTLKRQITKIERLTGKVLVVSNGHIVTAYHKTTPIRPSPGRKRLRRRAKARAMDDRL